MNRFLLFVIATFVIFSCTPETIYVGSESNSDNEGDIAKAEDVYFVRYAAEDAGAYVTYTREDGKNVSVADASTDNGTFVRTVGPVYKGFSCTFRVDRGPSDYYDIPMRIEVKRNDEPFVVKVEGHGMVKYTIE